MVSVVCFSFSAVPVRYRNNTYWFAPATLIRFAVHPSYNSSTFFYSSKVICSLLFPILLSLSRCFAYKKHPLFLSWPSQIFPLLTFLPRISQPPPLLKEPFSAPTPPLCSSFYPRYFPNEVTWHHQLGFVGGTLRSDSNIFIKICKNLWCLSVYLFIILD